MAAILLPLAFDAGQHIIAGMIGGTMAWFATHNWATAFAAGAAAGGLSAAPNDLLSRFKPAA